MNEYIDLFRGDAVKADVKKRSVYWRHLGQIYSKLLAKINLLT